ncbi:efflux RND transporter periplasmic adaptor subunit [Thermaurantiacus sp.]
MQARQALAVPGAGRGGRFLPAVLLLFVGACGAGAGDPAVQAPRQAETTVRLFEVGSTASAPVIRAAGTVRIRRETPLAFWTAGIIARLDPREGDQVRAGMLLAALDTRTIDAEVAAARADLARARAERDRQRKLFAQGWVAKARVDTAEAAAGAAAAALERALFAQKNSRIVAPADGIILARRAEPGQTVAAGDPVLVLGEARSGHVIRVPLAAEDIAGLKVGMPVGVDFPSNVAPAMSGRVIEIAGRADERTGTFQLEVALPPDPALRSGLIGQVAIARPQAASASGPFLVPATALFAARAGEAFVWRLDPESSSVKAVLVRIGDVGPGGVVVESGLAAGDRIVRTGVDRLSEGARVKVAGPA